MLKRIVLIGLFTGLAHLLSFFSVSYVVSQNASELFVSRIADVESGIALMLAIMSFGLQQVATRDIVIKDNWRGVLEFTQRNRLSMGLFLFFIGLIAFTFTRDYYYLIFLLGPLLALNVDYGLYGRGKSLEASFLSLIKVGIPAIMLILLGYLSYFEFNLYFASVILAWLSIGLGSNWLLKTSILIKPFAKFYNTYLKNSKIGFTDIVLTTLKLGILTLAKPLYTDTIIANSFIVLKLYVLVKGVQRVVFQAFYKDLVNIQRSFLIDKIGLLIGVLFFSLTFLYPTMLIETVFSEEYLTASPLFLISGITVLISSISICASPRMLLLNRDEKYIKSYAIAFIGALLFLYLSSLTDFNFYGIIGAILCGEIILNLALVYYIKEDFIAKERFMFFGEVGLLFIVLFIFSQCFDVAMALILSILIVVLYGVYFLMKHRKQFL